MPDLPFPLPGESKEEFKEKVWELMRILFEENLAGYKVGDPIISGGVTVSSETTPVRVGNNLIFTNYYLMSSQIGNNYDYSHQVQVPRAGDYRVKLYVYSSSVYGGEVWLYKNYQPVKRIGFFSDFWVAKEGDITDCSVGDLLQIYIKSAYTWNVRYVRLCGDSDIPLANIDLSTTLWDLFGT